MREQPLVAGRVRTVLLAAAAVLLGAAVVIAAEREALPPGWDWVKRVAALAALVGMAAKLLGPARVQRIRDILIAGLRVPGGRLVAGAGEILSGYMAAEASGLNRRGAMKTGHYRHMTALGGGRNAVRDAATGEVILTNPYDRDLMAKSQAFRDARLYWVYRIVLLGTWIGLQVFMWRLLLADLKPQPPGLRTVVFAAFGILFGGVAIAFMAFVFGRFLAVAAVAVIGTLLGLVFALLDLLLVRPALRIARLTWLMRPVAAVSFVIVAAITIQDLLG